MSRGFVLLLFLSLVSCQSPVTDKPPVAEQAASPEPSKPQLPRFAQVIGQLDKAGPFTDFLDKHANQNVELDVTIPGDEFQGGSESTFDFVTLFDDCESLPEGQKPQAGLCTGTEIPIGKGANAVSFLKHEGDKWHLRGRFRVGKQVGPNQGLMSIRINPVD